jgi:hypothetical protein
MPFWDKDKSKLKLVVLFPHGIPNQVWYSPLKQNNWDDEKIIHKMVQRLSGQMKGYRKIQIYDNISNTLKYIFQ